MKNIIKYSTVFLLILLLNGCVKDKWMNPAPVTSLSDLTAFDTKDRILAQINGMYTSLKDGNHLGGRFMVYNDVRADNFLPTSSNLVTCFATWNHTVISSTNEVQNLWGAVYQTINVVNVFLDGLKAAKEDGKLSFLTDAEYNQYRSEGLTIRAICYFDLMQMYSKPYKLNNGAGQGVPLRLVANKSAAENDLAPSTVAEVYTQILADLNEAEPLAILNHGSIVKNTTRVHRNTIIAYKTRVLLHMQNWAQVATESAKIVPASAPFKAGSGVPNELNATFAAVFTSPSATNETILSLPMTASNNPGTQNNLAHYFKSGTGESYYLNTAAGSAYALMDAADARKVMTNTVSGKTYITKYVDQANKTDYPQVIRYAEVMLNRAEALVHSGNAVTQEAVDLLNAVRTRSFAAGAYTLASFANADEFYTAILNERNMEFLGEGIRNMDLLRLGLTIPGKSDPTFGTVASIAPTAQSYYWPVPDSELSYNKLMTPNN
ncbi:MAG TPA: RagB/SusD family nutrient uptake outer membrane protein [Bacteroidales bacterium]|nr:RagB/SusD family nutrient uptake outer membrane protein [Bacteroidales bacterium]